MSTDVLASLAPVVCLVFYLVYRGRFAVMHLLQHKKRQELIEKHHFYITVKTLKVYIDGYYRKVDSFCYHAWAGCDQIYSGDCKLITTDYPENIVQSDYDTVCICLKRLAALNEALSVHAKGDNKCTDSLNT